MKLKIAWDTHIGMSREINQDAIYTNEELNLFIVADGIGGAPAGEVASRLAVKAIRDYVIRNPKAATETVVNAIKYANDRIYQGATADPQKEGMGSTSTLLWFKNGRYYIGHVGDTRAFRIRGKSIVQITQDHSLERQTHVLTRWLGGPSIEIDSHCGRIKPGDSFLLCSDGLHRYVSDQQIVELVHLTRTPKELCEQLIDLANDCGGEDNISVVFVNVKKLGVFCRTKRIFTEPGKVAQRITALTSSIAVIAILLFVILVPEIRKTISRTSFGVIERTKNAIKDIRKTEDVVKNEESLIPSPPVHSRTTSEKAQDVDSPPVKHPEPRTSPREKTVASSESMILTQESGQSVMDANAVDRPSVLPRAVPDTLSVVINAKGLASHSQMTILINQNKQYVNIDNELIAKNPNMEFKIPLGLNVITWVIPGSNGDSALCEDTVQITVGRETISPPDRCRQRAYQEE